ncbi:MAG: Uma2 family endonuclease [Chloroflexi bacterium]|nr:Uma2 family endonuclease [Chloroflexota bacterium]
MAATVASTKATAQYRFGKYPDIFYDEPDREDRVLQFPPLYRVIGILFEMYKDSPDVFATGDGFIFYDESDGNRRVGPDFLIAFGVDAVYIRESEMPNYLVWEIGKVPDFVMEVASPSTWRNDLGHKRELYERLGVQEYWRFDHKDGEYYGQPLAGERLVDGVYQPYELSIEDDGSIKGYSELLDMVFCWDGHEFDVMDPETGMTLHRITIAEARAEAAEARIAEQEARAEAAEMRIVEQEARTEAAEARAEESEARERSLLEEIARLRQQQP